MWCVGLGWVGSEGGGYRLRLKMEVCIWEGHGGNELIAGGGVGGLDKKIKVKFYIEATMIIL